jgi:hypothetical protein
MMRVIGRFGPFADVKIRRYSRVRMSGLENSGPLLR